MCKTLYEHILSPETILFDRYCYSAHFADEKTKVVKWPRSNNPGGFPSLDLTLDHVIPEPALLSISYMKEGQRSSRGGSVVNESD